MITLHRPGRAAAAAGAVVAVSATTLMAFVGIASADEPGRCLDNVNVREEPSPDARIIAVCDAGTAVELGRTSDGFVEIIDLGGWAVAEYVAAAEDAEGAAEEDGDATSEAETPAAEPGAEPEPTGRTSAGEPADELMIEPAGPAEERTTGGTAGTDEPGTDEPTDEPEADEPEAEPTDEPAGADAPAAD